MLVSGLIKRSLAQVMGGPAVVHDAAAKPGAKNPSAKEVREEEKRSREHTLEGAGLGDSYCYC